MALDPIAQHVQDSVERVNYQAEDKIIIEKSKEFMARSIELKYSYNFQWFSRPIIQYPQDIVALQEIVSHVKPDKIIETGIAHGGSLVLSASLLALLDVMDGLDPRVSSRKVIGIDVDIRDHNRVAIDNHPLRFKMILEEGSSIDPELVSKVEAYIQPGDTVLVLLDSNHTHAHVLAELNSYAPLVSVGSYCIVFDTNVEDLPPGSFPDRPWDIGNNPKTAALEWLDQNPNFEIDSFIQNKLLLTVAPSGYLRRTA